MNLASKESNPSGLINDFKNALGQQLYYWGRDVAYPKHNLLCEFGLKKYESNGKGSKTCYKMKFNNDIIELHQLCIGLYCADKTSFIFTRQYRRCWNYNDSKPPLPGYYNKKLISTTPIDQLEISCRKFAQWLFEYEIWISKNTPPSYREDCFKSYKRIPKSKLWLPPSIALEWLKIFKDSPRTLERSKEWKRQYLNSQ
ncbi:MAG: hypothetical protein N4A33_03015 [Bacteriovoracaceae bacterium]|jgi:hypothetical protein|nr:hypothetical protein [Bacteriovoracaceae bacterium]